jgi:N-acetylmuramoyl-L-alanine amidase
MYEAMNDFYKGGFLMFLLFRRRSFYTVLLVCTLLVASGVFLVLHNQPATSPTLSWVMAEKTFLIDPGHGGTFPGRVNESSVLEKDINLAIALKLDQLLEETGAHVVMTRRADNDLIPQESKDEKLLLQQRADLAQRIQIGTESKADYFISIHCNSIPNAKWSGAQTFYNPDDPDSQALAQAIQQMLIEQLGDHDREALPREDTYLFRNATMPTVIVECGFLSNEEEAAKLQDAAYQQQLAWAIYLGVNNYLAAQNPQ